jgi:hypothetical protein
VKRVKLCWSELKELEDNEVETASTDNAYENLVGKGSRETAMDEPDLKRGFSSDE